LVDRALHLNLDDAWRDEPLALPVVDARAWGPQLRFSAPQRLIAEFYREHETNLASPFLLYGSGDFHYLTALRLRCIARPIVVVSFDNHPDWDVRPPKWGCGGWVNRALELPHVRHVSVWGCGNFECWWPHQIFGNRHAERAGTLEVHPWADDRSTNTYVTIDLDCLCAQEAVTNWESGRFSIADLEWALGKLRESSHILGGDICGAYSKPEYARFKQRFAAEFDHPKIQLPSSDQIRAINFKALQNLWPPLTGTL